MPQVWADSEAAAAALQLLPDLTSSSLRARPAAGTGRAATGTQCQPAAASSFAGSDQDQAQRAIVLQLLQPANVGPAARWSSFEVDVAARTADGTLAKQSARCPWKEAIHNSNQLKVSIKNGQLHVSCWAPVCRGRRIIDTVKSDRLEALFRSSTTNSSNDSSDVISDFNVDGDSGPSPFEDDTELNRQLAIEQDIRTEFEQKRGRQLANFGMPLRMEPGVSTTHRRYLLPRSLDEPGAEQQMKDLMMHARLGIRSPMDTAKSSAFIMYIKWLLQRFPTLRIILVACRVTLAGSLKQRLTDEGVPCLSYLDCDAAELRNAQVAIVQLDSICKLEGARPYDLVLLDES
jgi:hypothetical protein